MPVPSAPDDRLERERRDLAHQALWIVRGLLVLVGTMPWWLPLARAYLPLGPVGTILDALFIVICHRAPERTIELAGVAMPVCSRCAGIFSGLALGAALVWPRIDIRYARIGLVVAGLLMIADVVTQDTGLHPPWHATRLATGALLGWIASAALVSAIMRERRLATPRKQTGWTQPSTK
jgi:uncharacterized membrane protein